MELYEIKNGLDKAHLLIDEYRKSAQIDEKLREIEGLSYQTMQDGFWDDPTKAKKIYDELNDMKKITDEYENLCQSLNSLDETLPLNGNPYQWSIRYRQILTDHKIVNERIPALLNV